VLLALPALIPIAIMIFAPGFGRRMVQGRGGRGKAGAEPATAYAPPPGPEIPVAVG